MIFTHTTVLKKEAIDNLVWNPKGIYIDGTCGGGGHSEELLNRFPEATLICIDWHLDALKATQDRLKDFKNIIYFEFGSFAHLDRILEKLKISKVDGILTDFGTSQFQIKEVEGFSFMKDTFLDMRMSKSHFRKTAYDILKRYSEKDLANLFFTYGEERNSRKIAKHIVEVRKEKLIATTFELSKAVMDALHIKPNSYFKINPATKVFQALRIEVNQELKHIEDYLKISHTLLNENGKMCCISFHSLEDRLVKEAFKNKKIWKPNKELILPSEEEIKQNPASRSAKMRVASLCIDKEYNLF
jgi:16S rRNA (cytosine1402-N4)-methyltransferase